MDVRCYCFALGFSLFDVQVRHHYLVALLGYSIEGNEIILVYEYMPQRALSRHLFHSVGILLGDDIWAKVSDFGLVKLAPDGEKSVVTRLAGTFGYLAPEYAGKHPI